MRHDFALFISNFLLLYGKPEFNIIMKQIQFTVTLLLLQLLVAPYIVLWSSLTERFLRDVTPLLGVKNEMTILERAAERTNSRFVDRILITL